MIGRTLKQGTAHNLTIMNLDEDLISETENMELTDREIFTKIWTSPRLVFRYLNDTRYDKFVIILLILAGICRAFDRASLKNMGDDLPLIGVLSICIILGGLLGWIFYYIYAALLSWTGTWLNGKGNTNSLLRMISHAMIPMIVSLILLIPQISVFGNEIFQSDSNIYGTGMAATIMYYFTSYLGIALSIWTIVLLVIGISEVQKISVWESILNMILPVLVFVIPLAMIAFVLGDLFGK